MSILPNQSVLFVPRNLYLLIQHDDGVFSKLLHLNSVVSSYGQESAARFILINSLYNSQDVKNIFPPLGSLKLPSVEVAKYDTTLANQSPKTYEQVLSRVEGLRLSGETFESLTEMNQPLKAHQYHASKLFRIAPEIFGVTTFVMDLPEDKLEALKIKRDHLLGQLNFLHNNGVSLPSISSMELFKLYVQLTNEIATL